MSDGTHVSHCCIRHGCKYGDSNCPVANGRLIQEFDCEVCDHEKDKRKELINILREELVVYSKDKPVDSTSVSNFIDWMSKRF